MLSFLRHHHQAELFSSYPCLEYDMRKRGLVVDARAVFRSDDESGDCDRPLCGESELGGE